MIDKAQFIKLLNLGAERIIAHREELNELDRAIGDFDHGSNMARGFTLASEKLATIADSSIGDILKQLGMVLISNVGGASGPLYGTAFLKASMAIGAKEAMDEADIIKAYELVIEGIKQRGASDRGNKTMLDALIPAYEAFSKAIEDHMSVEIAARKASDAANEGVEYTKTIVATKGRASYLGERSIGHADPGARSLALLLSAFADGLEA